VQVAPIKPKLKPPGTKRLKPQYDVDYRYVPLSNIAFKFNLRRFNKPTRVTQSLPLAACQPALRFEPGETRKFRLDLSPDAAAALVRIFHSAPAGRCRLNLSNSR